MEKNNNSEDKSKITMLISLIVVVSILLVGFVFIAVLDLTHKEAETRLNTTTRRTVKTTELITEDIKDDEEEEEEDEEDELEEVDLTTTTTSQTQGNTTTKVGTTKTTKKPTTTKEVEVTVPASKYTITNSSTTYPDALDSWEWDIVDMINEARRKNGLNELLVASELRTMAEDAAYIYYTNGDAAAKSYLINYANMRMYSNLLIDSAYLFENTINSTNVTTNPYIKYIGVGVLLKKPNLDTYYYILVYE